MAIMHGFGPNGEFVAIDTATRAAVCGSKGSQYWREAKDDPEATAAEMIADTLDLREKIPELPSVQPDAWNQNFFALAQLISR